MPPQGPVDAVYTWVDGSDPSHQAALARYGATSPASPEIGSRFADHSELRFSLRSLEQFAPFVRTVYLVTNGQVPAWLRTDHPRLRLVTHSEIFQNAEDLPTFNSFAIETNLHRIPDLADTYLYLNDDVFFGRPVGLEDFLLPNGGQHIHLETWFLPRSKAKGSMTDRALAYTVGLLDAKFGVKGPRPAIAHTPRLYRKGLVAELASIWPAEFEATASHRFRSPTDLALHVAYVYFLIESGTGRYFPTHLNAAKWPSTYAFVQVTADRDRLERQLQDIDTRRPKFFCLNDDVPVTPPGGQAAVWSAVTEFLEACLPAPSSFERA